MENSIAIDNLLIIVYILIFSFFISLSAVYFLMEGYNKLVILFDITAKIIVMIIMAFAIKWTITEGFPRGIFILIAACAVAIVIGFIYRFILEKLPF